MRIILTFSILVFLLSIPFKSFANTTVKVGVIFAKTGKASQYNLLLFRAVRFAADEINKAGGILNKKIELLEFDNQSTAIGSKIMATKASKTDICALIGASWSSHSVVIAPVMQQSKIPMISPTSTNPEVTLLGDYIFRVCFTDAFQGRVLANFAFQDLKAKKAATLTNSNSRYSQGLTLQFMERFKSLGGQISFHGEYLEQSANFANLLVKTKNSHPDVIFLPGHQTKSAMIIKQARKMGMSMPFMGGDGWDAGIYDVIGELMHGNYSIAQWHQDNPDPRSQAFKQNYIEPNKESITSETALAYDAVYLLKNAIERAKSFDRDKIKNMLATTKKFQGITGNIRFDENGDPIKPAIIIRFENLSVSFIKSVNP